MSNNAINGSVIINATFSQIWEVLTNPEKVLLYTGSTLETNWKTGSPITWSGDMHGTKYQNKGVVLENVPHQLLRFSYWSGMGGDADLPENYSEITYSLQAVDRESIKLTYNRINIPTSMEQQLFEAHLPHMLEEIKKQAEN